MKSTLFDYTAEQTRGDRFALANPQLLRVLLGADVLATKGTMVAYQGNIAFDHESSGSIGRLVKKVATSEDLALMRVRGQGEVYLASGAGYVFFVELANESLSVGSNNLLAFDTSLDWAIQRNQGAGAIGGGLFNTILTGTGTVALSTIGKPVVLDCTDRMTYVDVDAAVAWSAHLKPSLVSSANVKSLLRGGSGELAQYAFNGPGFVVVQPSEFTSPSQSSSAASSSGGIIGELFK